MNFTFINPYPINMYANSMHDAIKNYVKMYQSHRINQLILQDREKYYKAKMKYFKNEHHDNVGIKVFAIPKPTESSPLNISGLSNIGANIILSSNNGTNMMMTSRLPQMDYPIMSPVIPMMPVNISKYM